MAAAGRPSRSPGSSNGRGTTRACQAKVMPRARTPVAEQGSTLSGQFVSVVEGVNDAQIREAGRGSAMENGD